MSAMTSSTHARRQLVPDVTGSAHRRTQGVRQLDPQGRLAGAGDAFNLDTQKWENDRCPHNHDKQSAARKCGEAAAKRLNREAKKAAS